jgi:hypothetical protein
MPKVKFVLLLPLTYNDGSEIPKAVHEQIEEEIFLLAGGYRYGGTGKGAYRIQSSEKQIDVTAEGWIVIDEDQEPALKQLVAKFAAILGQETLYLERTGGAVDFIPPLTPGEAPK